MCPVTCWFLTGKHVVGWCVLTFRAVLLLLLLLLLLLVGALPPGAVFRLRANRCADSGGHSQVGWPVEWGFFTGLPHIPLPKPKMTTELPIAVLIPFLLRRADVALTHQDGDWTHT
jgi:hypothetical protein